MRLRTTAEEQRHKLLTEPRVQARNHKHTDHSEEGLGDSVRQGRGEQSVTPVSSSISCGHEAFIMEPLRARAVSESAS